MLTRFLTLVVVVAFKAAYELEKFRHENSEKVAFLHAEMRKMMTVIILSVASAFQSYLFLNQLRLKAAKDLERVDSGGKPIKDGLQEIVDLIASDIVACSNACDTYLRKSLVVKVLAGPVWDQRLVAFVGIFNTRRKDFL
jgi:hypothetical protein